jgi:hypothetical protein
MVCERLGEKSIGPVVFFNDNGLKPADLGGRFFRMTEGVTSFLKSVSRRSQGNLLLSDGNDHLYRDPDYSWDAYIHA